MTPPQRLRIGVLPIVLGLTDGITNALGLAARSILHEGSQAGLGLALRIAFFALVTAVFSVFVARYVELRVALIRAGRQLNLLERGALATTRLGRAARLDALADAVQASLASFAGALLPLGIAVAFPDYPWLPLVLAVGMLTFLGLVIGRRLGAHPGLWAATLAVAGMILVVVGATLDIA
jgi:VIT1/CCC1 family predicted Fe2+/Mn2+ transporter